MHNNARHPRTHAAVRSVQGTKGGATASGLHSIGELIEKAGASSNSLTDSTKVSDKGVAKPIVVQLFTEPHEGKPKKPKPAPGASQKAASGKGKKDKVSPPKAEDTATPAEVKIPAPPVSVGLEVSVTPGTATKSVRKTNKLGESQFGNCIMCGAEIFSAVGSWPIPHVYLDEKGGNCRDKDGNINFVAGYTCSAKCEQDKEDSRTSYLDQNIARVKVTCFNGPPFVPPTEDN